MYVSKDAGNRPIAVKVSAVGDPCPVKVGLGSLGQALAITRRAGIGATSPLALMFAKDGIHPLTAIVRPGGPTQPVNLVWRGG